MSGENIEIMVLEKNEDGLNQRFVKNDEISKYISIVDKEDEEEKLKEKKKKKDF